MSDSQRSGAPESTEVQAAPPLYLLAGGNSPAGTGRYELRGEIARGGMGVVYRARDCTLGRDVGLKTLLTAPPDGSAVAERFRAEARVTGQLQHPNIPPVHDLGDLPDGRPFLAMKLIDGRTLHALLGERPDPGHGRERFVAIFEQIAQGVGYAHSRGVVHRDLKPLNIMVGAFGEVQVMDWGLAKELGGAGGAGAEAAPGGRADDTQPGAVMGTPAYMPPEQARGAVDRIDARTDVFALGGILAAILTGQPPYVGADPESTRQLAAVARLDDCFARLDGCGAEPELVALAKRCLAAERDDRPRDAGEVAAAVADLRAAAEHRAREAEQERAAAEARAVEQRKRWRVQMLLAAAVALLTFGGAAVAWWQDRQTTQQKIKDERVQADRKTTEARLEGERDAEARNKERQARDGVRDNRKLAVALRREYKFKLAEAALTHAAELARNAPDLLPEVEQSQRDLALVIELDRVRLEMSRWDPQKKSYMFDSGPPAYRRAFLDAGLDLEGADISALAARIRTSEICHELLDSLDDWAVYDKDKSLERRLLAVLRAVDSDPWANRLWDTAVRDDLARLERLAEDADLARLRPCQVVTLAKLLSFAKGKPEPLLVRAATLHLDSFPLVFQLGVETLLTNDAASARYFQAALAVRPDNLSSLYNLASGLSKSGQATAARAAFEEYIRRDPTYASAHYNFGLFLQDQKQNELAEREFREAIRHNPQHAKAHHSLGQMLLMKKKSAEATAAIREAVRIDPNYAEAYTNLGYLLITEGKQDEAQDACKAAIAAYRRTDSRNPGVAMPYTNLGLIHLTRKSYSDAVECAKAAIKADPNFPNAHGLLGTALQQLGDISGARAAFTRAQALDGRWGLQLAMLPRLPVAPPPRAVTRP